MIIRTASAAKLFPFCPFSLPSSLRSFKTPQTVTLCSITTTTTTTTTTKVNNNNNNNNNKKTKKEKAKALAKEKKRTRSDREFELDSIQQFGDSETHIPVMLGEVVDVFSFASKPKPLHSFVDCTLGAAGHSSAIIQAHPELKLYIGMDVDPTAFEKARARIDSLLHSDSRSSNSDLKVYSFLKNFKCIKSVLREVDENVVQSGVDGILMDLGMSSMQVNNPERGFSVLCDGPLDMRMDLQASLKAEDILNSWPATEVGRILRDYGEESNWRTLQNRIVKARSQGGLHSTGELVRLIQNATSKSRGGRQGWIKTVTRVFQAVRIAVNDELKTLEDSLHSCFDCLATGGRLAVISFHSLEDRIVKQTFLNIIENNYGAENMITADGDTSLKGLNKIRDGSGDKEAWIKSVIHGSNGSILTKRPMTPSEEEERLNRRSRSAKLRVIQKI